MIITPVELEQWVNDGKNFKVFDIRPRDQIIETPITKLDNKTGSLDSIKNSKNPVILICQYGIITEGMIIENNLQNTYSLLGGVQAWNDFIKENYDISRWSRQTVLDEIGISGQKKFFNTWVAIVGIGGLGCPAAQSLVACGIGYLKIIDGDTVDLSNLHRQHLYSFKDIGEKKVSIAKKSLKKLSNRVKIDSCSVNLNENNQKHLGKDDDIIFEATDNISARRLIDKVSKKNNIPMVYGSLYKFEGQVSIFNINNAGGYAELFPGTVSGGDTCSDAGVLGMLPSIIGNIQALEAIKIITGIKPNLAGKLLIYNALNHKTEIFEL